MKVIFVADYFEEYLGGAELTTEALISACPHKVMKIRANDLTEDLIDKYKADYWIFGNIESINEGIISKVCSAVRYSAIEYDYKLCVHRCPELHKFKTGKDCDCDLAEIKAFYQGADNVFFMSQAQMDWAVQRVPFVRATVLSSVFSRETLQVFRDMRANAEGKPRNGKWIIIFSDSWVKGSKEAVRYAIANDLDYEIIYKKPYIDILIALSQAEGYIYTPAGSDSCPRAVIEAKLLGCNLILNDYVLQRGEAWFDTDDYNQIIGYLESRLDFFWGKINEQIEATMGNKTA